MKKAAFVIGASGSVGQALVDELLRSEEFSPILSFGRSKQNLEGLTEITIDMTPTQLSAAVIQEAARLQQEIIGFSVLGIGGGTARLSIDEHRAVDVQLNQAFAQGLRESKKAKHLNFMSAVGANPNAKTTGSGAAGFARYNRVKGEAEEAVKANGPQVVSIFRPAMIIGSKHTPFLLEKLLPLFAFVTPKHLLSISVKEIAQSMIACALQTPKVGAVYHYSEMQKWRKNSSKRS